MLPVHERRGNVAEAVYFSATAAKMQQSSSHSLRSQHASRQRVNATSKTLDSFSRDCGSRKQTVSLQHTDLQTLRTGSAVTHSFLPISSLQQTAVLTCIRSELKFCLFCLSCEVLHRFSAKYPPNISSSLHAKWLNASECAFFLQGC